MIKAESRARDEEKIFWRGTRVAKREKHGNKISNDSAPLLDGLKRERPATI